MKKFIKNNETFVCDNCGGTVPLHATSSRDHCCFCLFGKHVDINPGDRLNECKALLKPIGIKSASGKTQIAYDCVKCNQRVLNIVADDDNSKVLSDLYSKVWI